MSASVAEFHFAPAPPVHPCANKLWSDQSTVSVIVVDAVMEDVEVSVPTMVTVYAPVATLELDGVDDVEADVPEPEPPQDAPKHTSASKEIPTSSRSRRGR